MRPMLGMLFLSRRFPAVCLGSQWGLYSSLYLVNFDLVFRWLHPCYVLYAGQSLVWLPSASVVTRLCQCFKVKLSKLSLKES